MNVVGALAGPLSAVFEFTEPGDRDTGARRLLLDPATGQPLGL